MKIKLIGVVGAGQMGAGIAQVAAQSGLKVMVSDVSPAALERGRESIDSSLGRLVKKGLLDEKQADESKNNISWWLNFEVFDPVDLVIEAAPESESLKRDIFTRLDKVVQSGVILASNTSSISITKIAQATSRPELCIGMHFMNPVPVMKLVEIIRGLQTSDETYSTICALAKHLGKTTTTSKDFAGFIANRLLMPFINEAFFALYEGIATAKDIDATMKLGMNHPMGPLELADFVGLDTCLAVCEVMHRELGDDKYRPCPLLRQYVAAGWLGKKTKKGVYEY